MTIVIHENLIDLEFQPKINIPNWQPKIELKPYKDTTKLYLDIETLGLDSNTDRITMIGFRDHLGQNYIFSDISEEKLLKDAMNFLIAKKPEFLFGYNFIKFDIPFIINRCYLHGVKHPFKIMDYEVVLNDAQLFNKPVRFPATYAGFETSVIDLYHAVLKDDFVKRTLVSYTLKQVVLQRYWREEERLELSYNEMVQCWQDWEEFGDINQFNKLKKYLIYDLEDTELIADKLIPQVYYQKIVLPQLKPQQIFCKGNGAKWNLIFKDLYPEYDYRFDNQWDFKDFIEANPNVDPNLFCVPDEKQSFEGGYTEGFYGFYQNVSKGDVASLYPSIMLSYGITTRKDHDYRLLGVLKYLYTERLKLKALGAKGDAEAKQMEGALKVIINSVYGGLGTVGIHMNDYRAAAMVTAIGRKIVKLMMSVIKLNGGQIVEVDTDGVMFCSDSPEHNYQIFTNTNRSMPNGISITYEWDPPAKAVYIPASVKVKKRAKTIELEGQRKNYIVWQANGKVKASGKFRKRDRCVLEKTFELDYLNHYQTSIEAAESFYHQLRDDLITKKYPVDNLKITRKIKVTEKVMLKVGSANEVVTYYWGIENNEPAPVLEGAYNSVYYVNLLDTLRRDLLLAVNPDLYYQDCDIQLKLID